jgi:outer membrane scaffolding protein for murein synthesis (MipA/OmpV family)
MFRVALVAHGRHASRARTRDQRLMMPAPEAPRRLSQLAAVLLVAWLASPVAAHEEPLFEFGLGIGAIAFEDYRGSDTTHAYPLPIPYLVYNGKFLKADREGVRGTLFNQDWVELNLSGNATTPVKNDRERSGMPDLRSTLEIGPSLDFHLLHSEDKHIRFDLRMPLRAALTVQASPKYIGWTFTPRFALDVADPFGYAGWHAGVLTGPLFAERRYHAYFYTVAPQYATVDRPAYQATGGYAGTQAITALSKRFPHYWVGAYVRYDTLSGAAFTDSPLVQRNSYWSAGFGISWMIHRSEQMVEVPD